MRTSKSTYEDVEFYHDKGQFIVIGLPEYLSDISNQLTKASFTHSDPEFVVSPRENDGKNLPMLDITMFEIRLEHSAAVHAWFETNKGSFVPDNMSHFSS